jgi:hypothetical protein
MTVMQVTINSCQILTPAAGITNSPSRFTLQLKRLNNSTAQSTQTLLNLITDTATNRDGFIIIIILLAFTTRLLVLAS